MKLNKYFFSFITAILNCIFFIVAIFSSRGSTASVGLIFVPIIFLISFVITFVIFQTKQKSIRIIFSIGTIVFTLWNAKLIFDVKKKNQLRDEAARIEQIKYAQAINLLNKLKEKEPEKFEINIIELEKTKPERATLLAILERIECPITLLEKYAKHDDLGLVLTVAKHPKTPGENLEYIFRKQRFPFYYYSTLAANPNTPPAILRELFQLRDKNTLIVPNLKSNPKTPQDVLNAIGP